MTPQDMYTKTPELRHFISSPKLRFGGLPNVGNSCYINSSLQMLFNIPQFRKIVGRSYGTVGNILGQIFTSLAANNDPTTISEKIKTLKYRLSSSI